MLTSVRSEHDVRSAGGLVCLDGDGCAVDFFEDVFADDLLGGAGLGDFARVE